MSARIDVMKYVDVQLRALARETSKLNRRAEFFDLVNSLTDEFEEDGKPGLDELMSLPEDSDEETTEKSKYSITSEITYDGAQIVLTLKEGQSINEIKPLLARIVRTRQFKPATYQHADKYSQCRWRFETISSFYDNSDAYQTTRTLLVVVTYGDSQVCTMEPTGEMAPVMKLVCHDGNHVSSPDDTTATLAEEGTE